MLADCATARIAGLGEASAGLKGLRCGEATRDPSPLELFSLASDR